jgi:hypothetical protein
MTSVPERGLARRLGFRFGVVVGALIDPVRLARLVVALERGC